MTHSRFLTTQARFFEMPVFHLHTEDEKLTGGSPLSGIEYIDCIIHYIP